MSLSRWTRLPLRRAIHTPAPRSRIQNRLPLALAFAALPATYVAYRLTSDSPSAPDSAPNLSSTKRLNASLPPEPVFAAATTTDDPVSSESSPASEETSHLETTDSETAEETRNAETPSSGGETSNDAAEGGAYNPVTGEINWDCPCLGGMAHGPCGLQFREAFSCFVFSEDEPKGINCVDKFKAMQDCFREHPEVYGDEIMDDDEDAEQPPAHNAPPSSNNTPEATPEEPTKIEPQKGPPSNEVSISS